MDRGYQIRGVMSKSAMEFITPLSLAALTGEKVYSELFSLTDEAEMGFKGARYSLQSSDYSNGDGLSFREFGRSNRCRFAYLLRKYDRNIF